MAQSQYMTTAVFEHFFDAHTKSLRGEFARIDEKFEAVDQRFGSLEYKMDQKFEAVDQRFDAVDQKFDKLEYKISQNEAKARNYRLTRLHQKIQKITVVNTTSAGKETIKEPVYFPTTVKDFWNLRKKPGSLVYLLRFYNLSGWKSWGSYTSDLESSDSDCDIAPSGANDSPSKELCPPNSSFPSASSQSLQTLEDAVEAHPELAIQELAEEFGLDYDRIESTVQAYKTYHAQHRSFRPPPKRSNPPIVDRDSWSKRPQQQPRPSPPPPKMSLTFEEIEAILERQENPPRSEPSVHTQLGWAATSEEFELRQQEFYERAGIRRPGAPLNQPPRILPSGSEDITRSG